MCNINKNGKWDALVEKRRKEWIKCAERAYIEIPAEIREERKKNGFITMGLKYFIATENKDDRVPMGHCRAKTFK